MTVSSVVHGSGSIAAEAAALPGLETGHHEGQPALAAAQREPRVDARRVAFQGPDRRRVQGRQVALRRLPPAERPDEAVRVELGLPEELADAAGPDVAEDLHLPHPLGGMHESLGEEEVVGRVGVDVRDPRLVADHLGRGREPGDLERPAHLGLGPPAHPCQEAADGHRADQGDGDDDDEQARQQAADDSHGVPLLLAAASAPVPRIVPEPGLGRVSPAPPARPVQRGSSIPTSRVVAVARIASAKTRSARPTPRWVTSTRPRAGRGVASRMAVAEHRDRVGVVVELARGAVRTELAVLVDEEEARLVGDAGGDRHGVVDGDDERARREPVARHHLADRPERDAGHHDVGVADRRSGVVDGPRGADPGHGRRHAGEGGRPGRVAVVDRELDAGQEVAEDRQVGAALDAGPHDRGPRGPTARSVAPSGRSRSRRPRPSARR